MHRTVLIFSILFIYQATCFAQLDTDLPIPQLKLNFKKSKTDVERASVLLDEALAYVHKQGELTGDLDTALSLIKQSEEINNKARDREIAAKAYFVYSNALREKGDTTLGHSYIVKSIDEYKKLSAPYQLADAYLELSSYYQLESLADAKYKRVFFEEALPLFRKSGHKKKQADVLKELADYDELLRNDGLALSELKESLAIYTSIGYKNLQGVYDLLNIVSTTIGDFATAVQYGLLAAKTAEEQRDTSMQLCTIYSRLAVAYAGWSRVKEADEYQNKALAIAMKYNDNDGIKVTLHNLVFSFVKQHRWQEALTLIRSAEKHVTFKNGTDSLIFYICYHLAYVEAKKYTEASVYTKGLLTILPSMANDDALLASVYRTLVNYFIGVRGYEAAKKYSRIYREFAIKNNSNPQIASAYLASFKTDSAMGNFRSALAFYQSYKVVMDSMLNEKKTFQFAQMQVAFETEKKDKDIKLKQQDIQLLTGRNELQLVQFRKAGIIRNSIIAFILLLLVVVYTGYRYKKRNNAVLQAQQEEINFQNEILKKTVTEKNQLLTEKEWLVKEIHHRVKNNLQIVISLLNTQSSFLKNDEAVAAITESRHRMEAMSLIHQKLYQSDSTTSVNMKTYIREMTDYLETSFTNGHDILFTLNVDELELDITQAIPVGLILNEAITNAMKYAFRDRQQGSIGINFKGSPTSDLLLEVRDNGTGLPGNIDYRAASSLGMSLMKGLSKQLEGTLEMVNDHGLSVKLRFKNIPAINSGSGLSLPKKD